MGYDVTFHPVSAKHLERYLFDIVNDPSLAPGRARELAQSAEDLEAILDLYGQFDEWLNDPEAPFEATFAVAAAAIAGYLHPYWYARGQAISFLAERDPVIRKLLTSLPDFSEGRFAQLIDHSAGFITENYTASGLLTPEAVVALEERLMQLAQPGADGRAPLDEMIDPLGLESLQTAIRYARSHNLGLVEATDLVIPGIGEFGTKAENLRAHYLKHLEPEPRSVEPAHSSNPPTETVSGPRTCPACSLINPPAQEVCDCGYDFADPPVSLFPVESGKKFAVRAALLLCVFALIRFVSC